MIAEESMKQFHIREHGEKDIGGILDLFRVAFQQEQTEEWFRWKYRCSPWGSKGYVAVHDEQIVAFYGGIRMQFRFKGTTLWSHQFCDVMSHPEYRGRLVSKTPFIVQLGELFYSENPMDFAFGFPSLRHSRLQSLRLGGKGYRLVQVYRKKDLRQHTGLWQLKVNAGWEFFNKEDLQKLQKNVQEKSAGLSGADSLHIEKNENYIRWRYRENPLKRYNLLVFRRMNRTKGLIIYTVQDSCFNVLEIFFQKEKDVRAILIALETHVMKYLHAAGIGLWLHPMEPLNGYLNELGYGREDGIPLAFRPVNTACGVTDEVFYNGYFYRMGDYDAS